MIVSVLVEINVNKIDKTFDYVVPNIFINDICVGKRVLVPFGKNIIEGFIIKIKNTSDFNGLKEIINVIDSNPILNKELLSLGKVISEENVCNLVSIYQAMLPKGMKAKKKDNVSIKKNIYVKLTNNNYYEFITKSKSKKQVEVINKLIKEEKILKKEFDSSVIKILLNKGLIELVEEEYYRIDNNESTIPLNSLNDYQKEAYNKIINSTKDVILLRGVTGSGKTEIYMHLIDNTIKEGKEAIMLVPEISLTSQIINRFKKHFGKKIAILHSGLSDGEKFDEYRKIINKEVSIVIGARSAIFAPFTNIGIIIIDEEHSTTYKQDHNPRYSAIDVAFIRGKNHNAKVILGSATPSIESYARALKGYYDLIKLDVRANNAVLPLVNIIDMKEEIRKGKKLFSKELLLNIEDRLNKNEQVMLLLNKRGYSSYLMCPNCGYVSKCKNCDITLTYHKSSNMNRCHYCGYAENNNELCPNCKKSELKNMGVGTEKVEEEIKEIFKDARIIRMDTDTTSRKGMHEKLINIFYNHEADILIGTQMISKGLDFPLVTLVGVINADTIINIPDFRSNERTYQLLSQVSGRAGRSDLPGKVIIQTFNPDNYSIKLSKSHSYEKFYEEEIKIRKKLYYPPYSFLALIKVGGKDFNTAINEAKKISVFVKSKLDKETILGPSVGSITRISNIYYFEIIIKYRDKNKIRKVLYELKKMMENNNKIKIEIDTNYISM